MKLLGNLGAALLAALLVVGGIGCPDKDPAPDPIIVSFTATPAAVTSGESSSLEWEIRNAVSLSLVDGVGASVDIASADLAAGSVAVSPTETTEYTLTATGGEGSTPVAGSLTITVAPPAVCGDGTVTGSEACDDGGTADGDYCAGDCGSVTGGCGDGTTQTNEVCDDSNIIAGDYCAGDCQSITGACGDGSNQSNEACDDGNALDGDYCSADCQTANGACGDGNLETFEACDDGNTVDGDYCSADCASVTGACGDGNQQSNETCDDGNTDAGDYCSADCGRVDGACGDGTQQTNEVCDDGNTDAGDYCSADCLLVDGACGDGTQQGNETCDDGNTVAGDYCSVDCLTVIGACGDTFPQTNEVCDDGNLLDGDGCRADCLGLEVCGDTLTDAGEACDDGNTTDGDGCRADCLGLEVCGDTILDAGEECDDGNTTDGDGCSALCVLEGGSCALPYPLEIAGAVGDGSFYWAADTTTFTSDFDSPCATSSGNPEGVASFVAPAAGDYIVSLTFASFDSVLWAWDAVCDPASVSLACDDALGDGGESLTLSLALGQQIFILVDGWGSSIGGALGTFELSVVPDLCGDSLVSPNETCDDGNTTAADGCDDFCQLETGFACPNPGAACRQIVCGDGFLDGTEACDDANTTAADGCDDLCATEAGFVCPTPGAACRQIVCGDGFDDLPETCDDGNTLAGDGCGATCVWEGSSCADPYDLTSLGLQGDGSYLLQQDNGNFTADYNATCDNSGQNGEVVSEFVAPAAGDYLILVESTEFNPVLWVWDTVCGPASPELYCNNDFSDSEATVENLASGQTVYVVVDGWGNSTTNEGNFTLTIEPVVCGDSVITVGAETCDDANGVAGDGCSDSCQVESGWDCPAVGAACAFVCGNGTIDASEICDDLNAVGGDGCAADCSAVEQGWVCATEGAACLFTCGDGTIEGNETCDDGNATSLDGCTDLCLLEGGFDCNTLVSPTSCSAWALPTAAGDLLLTEIMHDPALVSDSLGEWFEVHNPTATDFQLLGVTLSDETNAWESFTFDAPAGIPAGGYLVFASNPDPATNGGVTVDVVYATYDWNAQVGINLGNGTDGLVMTDGTGALLDSVIWDGGTAFPNTTGASMALLDGMDATQNDAGGVWCNGSTPYGDGDLGSPGLANPLANCTLIPLITENFDTWPLTGWTIEDGGDTAHTWQECTSATRNLIGSTNSFACADSDQAGDLVTMSEGLVSPSFDASAATFVVLTFVHYHNHTGAGASVVEVSVDGGGSYTPVATYPGDSINGAPEQLDISSIAAGQATVQVRFRYEDGGSWAWYWLIDDVAIVSL